MSDGRPEVGPFDRPTGEPDPGPEALTVSQACALAREVMEDNFALVRIQGEISRFLHHGSGHMYFQLKDNSATLSVAMFKGNNRRLKFRPEDGMDVLVSGRLSIYEPRGQFQFIASNIEPLGLGSLHLAFEQLKKRLESEGLFDQERKQPLPLLPARIGIVTSPTGAAVRDLLRVLHRRFADVPVLIAPCRVQGNEAPVEVAEAIGKLDRPDIDVIIVARGGGSLEDLWAFNEEVVARAIFACRTPVITGIGHEIDVTIADLVADRRAATPSAAAEIVVQSKIELSGRLRALSHRLGSSAQLALARGRERVRAVRDHRAMTRVPRQLQAAMQRIDELHERSFRVLERRAAGARADVRMLQERLSPRSLARGIAGRKERVQHLQHRLQGGVRSLVESGRTASGRLADLLGSVSPLNVLARGYSICHDPTGRVLRDAAAVTPDDSLQVRLHRGELECRVTRTHPPAPEER